MQSEPESFQIDVSKLLDLRIPEECVAGIEASLELLRNHARILDAYVLQVEIEAVNDEEQI
ncbi:MAG: DUF4089 domain-containing protein [Planctomycetota bacterium]|nr:DUF4089 domain-containing protein [Planctomycetota bacterium]